jgi:hypothetical protein
MYIYVDFFHYLPGIVFFSGKIRIRKLVPERPRKQDPDPSLFFRIHNVDLSAVLYLFDPKVRIGRNDGSAGEIHSLSGQISAEPALLSCIIILKNVFLNALVPPQCFYADPDPNFHFNTDPDPSPDPQNF